MVYAEHLLSFWESGILIHARYWVPTWLSPNNKLGCWDSNELPQYVTFHTCHNLLLGDLSGSCVPKWRKDSGSLWLVSPGFVSCTPSLCWSCFVSFWYNKSWSWLQHSPVTPSSKSRGLSWRPQHGTLEPCCHFKLILPKCNYFSFQNSLSLLIYQFLSIKPQFQ